MELTITNLKTLLLDTIGRDLLENGFEFSKNNFEFGKKIGKNKVAVIFRFYDHKPSWIEYTFRVEFTIEEIRKEAQRFSKFCNGQFSSITIAFMEGEFHPDTKNKEPKYQIDFTHKIYDLKNSEYEIEVSRNLLHECFLPLTEIYTNFEKFHERHLSDFKGAEEYSPLTSLLMAAKIYSQTEAERLVDYLWEKLRMDNVDNSNVMKQVLSSVVPYCKANS